MASKLPIRAILQTGVSQSRYKEATAAEAITPGHLIDLNGTGGATLNDVDPGIVANNLAMQVAVENDIFGKTLDDAYAIGDTVIYATLSSGDEFYGFVPAAAPAIVFNDPLTLDPNGVMVKGTAANAVARAREAVDNSVGGAIARIRAMVL